MAVNAIAAEPVLSVVETSPDYVKKQVEKIRLLQKTIKEVLVPNVDYGTIPGCGNKPTLFKSGAEKVLITFSLQSSYEFVKSTEEFNGKGFFSYTIRCFLTANGIKITEGLGHANSKETKWAYKWVSESNLPSDVDVDMLQQRSKKGQYGEYMEYRIEEEMCSKANTILKMAKKRAMVDAVLTVANLSELFTQDFDDLEDLETPQDKVTEIKEQIKAKQGIKANAKYICTECGKEIQKSAYDYSTTKFGKALCYNCQQKAKKNVTATAELPPAEEGK